VYHGASAENRIRAVTNINIAGIPAKSKLRGCETIIYSLSKHQHAAASVMKQARMAAR